MTYQSSVIDKAAFSETLGSLPSAIEQNDLIISHFKMPSVEVLHSTLNKHEIETLFDRAAPCIVRGFTTDDFGGCLTTWTPTFLRDACGQQMISVHSCPESMLIFSPTKNFQYKQMQFSELLDALEQEQLASSSPSTSSISPYYYFRSVGTKPHKIPASLDVFPKCIQQTFHLPSSILPSPKHHTVHSTILRLAHPSLQLWTHYDIPQNLLVQISGNKRVFIFPPDEIQHLYITSSSSPVKGITSNPDFKTYPLIEKALEHAFVAELSAGDILYIPSCWPHAVLMNSLTAVEGQTASKPSLCMSINVFFSSNTFLEKGLYHSKDVYGNRGSALHYLPMGEVAQVGAKWIRFNSKSRRISFFFDGEKNDLKPAEEYFQKLESTVIPDIMKLPPPFNQFYLRKMAALLLERANAL
ncbi:jmjC domain-containing protein C2 [Cardiosporidium cionae]|uniref:JmjC domain-containing protein C2 n=1 Tax=Cardiosporidium cionae TaxID=476202 RepID=A0ABQ7JET0_9APIC|nr:jmjC domain-containing protein C2 [Cardiosporidium cionae]|eukprot:KAF8822389.1 jmjC domain-containing protein C2 [Cardiosporidium cionae]